MKLTGTQRQHLLEAFLAAFPTWSELEQMVSFQLNSNLATLARPNNLREAVFDLIQWAEAKNKLDTLLTAARSWNPGNQQLRVCVEQIQALLLLESQTAMPLYTATAQRVDVILDDIIRLHNLQGVGSESDTSVSPKNSDITSSSPALIQSLPYPLAKLLILMEDVRGSDTRRAAMLLLDAIDATCRLLFIVILADTIQRLPDLDQLLLNHVFTKMRPGDDYNAPRCQDH